MKRIVIAVVGLTGSGKSEAVSRLVERGFVRIGFNDILYMELDMRGLSHIQKNEKPIREELRTKEGMGVMAVRSLPQIDVILEKGENVVIESLYSWSEYKVIKEKYQNVFKILAIYAPPEIRYERLSKREVRPLTHEGAKARDYAEIENIEKAGPIAIADWTIINVGTKEELINDVDKLVDGITTS